MEPTPAGIWLMDLAGTGSRAGHSPAGTTSASGEDRVSPQVLVALGHELKAPLATLRATLEVLADTPDDSEEARRELFPRLERSLSWLERLVGNLNTTALMQSGRLPLHRSHLAIDECVEAAVSLIEPLVDRKGQRVVVRHARRPLAVMADSTWLGQVLVNLLGNASAYSPDGARIDVSIGELPGSVEVKVHDQGPGIPRCEKNRIFRPYIRGRFGRESQAGLGLGLHIVRTLVQLHGGTVGVHSLPGQGATFWFRLPLAAPVAAHPRSNRA
jgi:signal transduction histidine kinase